MVCHERRLDQVFALLQARHPGRYQEGQVHTLQRRHGTWWVMARPDCEVMFEQVH